MEGRREEIEKRGSKGGNGGMEDQKPAHGRTVEEMKGKGDMKGRGNTKEERRLGKEVVVGSEKRG